MCLKQTPAYHSEAGEHMLCSILLFYFEAEDIQHPNEGATLKTQQWVTYTSYSSTPVLFRVLPHLKDFPV